MRKTLAATILAAGLAVAPALDVVHAQDAPSEEDDDNGNVGLFGLAGLLGLAGLAGLKRRDTRYDTRRDTRSSDVSR
jgi:MYXO-CTERM domain-containing protein